jgi:hypothetical protein
MRKLPFFSHAIPIPLPSNRMSPNSLETLVAQILLGFAGFSWGVEGAAVLGIGQARRRLVGVTGDLWSQPQLFRKADWAVLTKIDPYSLKYKYARWDQTARPSHLAFCLFPPNPFLHPPPYLLLSPSPGKSRTPPCSVHARPRFR